MAKKLFPVALMALVAGLLVISCDEDSTTDPTGTDPDPDPVVNEAPAFSTLTVGALLEDDTILVDEEYTRTLVATDEDQASLVYTVTTDPACGLTVTGDQMTWTPTVDDMGTYNVTITVTDSGGLTDEFSWTMVVSTGIDMSTSLIRFDVELETAQGIHPALANKPFVGLVYKKLDSSLVERVIHPSFTENFVLWTTVPIDTADSVIVDFYFDSDGDTLYDPPSDPNAPFTNYPDPSGRWLVDSVRCDPTGGYGIPLKNMLLFTDHVMDISDITESDTQ